MYICKIKNYHINQRISNSREYSSGMSARFVSCIWSQSKCRVVAKLSAAREREQNGTQ